MDVHVRSISRRFIFVVLCRGLISTDFIYILQDFFIGPLYQPRIFTVKIYDYNDVSNTGKTTICSVSYSDKVERKYHDSIVREVTGFRWIPLQRASNPENASISWSRHGNHMINSPILVKQPGAPFIIRDQLNQYQD